MSNTTHGLCRLSQRWHQQFCHSPSFRSHRGCFAPKQPVRQYRQAVRRKSPRISSRDVAAATEDYSVLNHSSIDTRNPIVVREFEQDEDNKDSINRVNPTEEITREIADVRAQMAKLEQELAVMKQGPFGPQSPFMESLPKDEREQLLQALSEEGIVTGEEEDVMTLAEIDAMEERDEELIESSQKPLGVTLRIPQRHQAYVRHFNKALQAVQNEPGNIQKSLSLWTWYLRCQQQVPIFSSIISDQVWNAIWIAQSNLKVRPRHLVILAQDMLGVEQSLSHGQWLEYIQALQASDDLATAFEVWTSQKQSLKAHPDHASLFWNTGVRILAALGKIMKAQETAFNAIHEQNVDPSILVPIISGWAKTGGREGLLKSWACYLKLRELLGFSANPQTLEDVSNAFLDVDHADLALGVFKDMLLTKCTSFADSQAVYKQATKHLTGLIDVASTEAAINRIGLSALTVLPPEFQNRFFFASWIKKLIGDGRVDAAAMVIDLMYERGLAPDAKPINGIIGAWLREGSPTARRKAEQMAWAMIDARANRVRQRHKSTGEANFRKIKSADGTGGKEPVFITRAIPSATIETFSIMLLHYTRRSDLAQAEKLTSAMTKDCRMRPNSFIMNHWLYADLRASRFQDVWSKYKNLRHEITPDLETFAALWDTAKAQYSLSKSIRSQQFPSARQLFAEMTVWTGSVPPAKMKHFKLDFSPELYEQIIRCFSLSSDLPGALCAMYSLQQKFDILPDDNSVRLICSQVTHLLPQDQKGRLKKGDPRARKSQSRHRNALSQVAEIVETIETKKKMGLIDQGVNPRTLQDPDSDLARQLRLSIMTEFVCMFLKRVQESTGSYINDINVAAKAMGVDLTGVDFNVSDDE